jgi:hypothetical protein
MVGKDIAQASGFVKLLQIFFSSAGNSEYSSGPYSPPYKASDVELIAWQGPAAKPRPSSRAFRSGLFRQLLQTIAVMAQVVDFLPQLVAVRPYFSKELAQTQDLRLQYGKFEGQFVSRPRCRFRFDIPAIRNIVPPTPDRRPH